MGSGSVSGGESGGMSGQQSSSQEPGDGGMGGTGGEGSGAGDQATANEKSDRDGEVVELPDDIPVDGSGDDVVGRQIREAAISMQESNPEAAEKLWDEYRKHTGIK